MQRTDGKRPSNTNTVSRVYSASANFSTIFSIN